MKTSELIKKLENNLKEAGDKEVIFAANKHSYSNFLIVNNDKGETTLALFDKIS